MNLYQGCLHNCIYCDGRSEKYYIDGEFGKDVGVKINAIKLLRRELNPRRRRIPLKKGYIMLGGGVGDSYQPLEQTYGLSRQALQVLADYNYPVHVLTKSCLIERDLDILQHIHRHSHVIVSFSFSSMDDPLSSIFEPCVPPPSERLKTLSRFKKAGIPIGIFLLPVIPFLTDTREHIEKAVQQAKKVGVDFIIFGGMTLKSGKQKTYFFQSLQQLYPELVPHYKKIYQWNRWGQPLHSYSSQQNSIFSSVIKKYKIPPRVPPELYNELLDINDLVVVILEQLDYLLQLYGKKSFYRAVASSIANLKEPLPDLKCSLRSMKGVGEKTEDIIQEILDTRKSSYLASLLR